LVFAEIVKESLSKERDGLYEVIRKR
jgi:hypothetical protein